MLDRRVILGAVVGLALAGLVAATSPVEPTPARRDGPLLSDCDGALGAIVIHYVPEAAPVVSAPYRALLTGLPAEVTVHVVCPDRSAFDDLCDRVGPTQCVLAPVLTGHAMTCWSRDRWLALGPGPDGRRTLLAPRGESAAGSWPARAGDERVAHDLARVLAGEVSALRSPLYFDGGDFVADDRTAFVTPAVLRRNLQRTVASAADLVAALEEALSRRVVLLPVSPEHHAGMFMMPVGGDTVLVGDPSLAARAGLPEAGLVPAGSAAPGASTPVTADLSPATQAAFDAVAATCTQAGYRVVRIPVLPGRDGRTYLTYLNVVIDDRPGQPTVYMPTYAHAPALNEAAAEVWRALGYEVRGVDCTTTYVHFGSLRCLVNVLARTDAA